MDRQCGPSTETETTTPTESTKMFDANSTTPSSDGNKNFQRLIGFVKSIIFWAKSMLLFLN